MSTHEKKSINRRTHIWKEFDEFEKALFHFTNGRQVVLWGYDRGGLFLQHLFSRANRKIEYIVDDCNMHPKIPVLRSVEICNNGLNPSICVVILVGNPDKEKEDFLKNLGFQKDINYIYAGEWFYQETESIHDWNNISYYDYLEYKFDVDILERKNDEEMEYIREGCLPYSPGIGYSLIDVLDNFVFLSDDAIFDFGCGKGGALSLFNRCGIKRIGGVEYDKQLFSALTDNFRKLGLKEQDTLINGDAAKVREELDDYNYFFMYNPFWGETFEKVIQNLEDSWKRKKRKMTLIYSGAYCHKTVVEHGLFKLSKRIYTDYAIRDVNIYTIL